MTSNLPNNMLFFDMNYGDMGHRVRIVKVNVEQGKEYDQEEEYYVYSKF